MNKSTPTDISKAAVDTLSRSSLTSTNAVQALTKAYQELATKNVETVTASFKALSAVKSPT